MGNKNNENNYMSHQAAAFVLRTIDNMFTTSIQESNVENDLITKMIFGQVHDAVEMACKALILMDDTGLEIEGDKNDGR